MLEFYGTAVSSRLLLGTAQYPSPKVLSDAVAAACTDILTVSLRRETAGTRTGSRFWEMIMELNVRVLPNTAGCHSVQEAVTTARMARDLFGTDWIKLEVIGHHDTLQPDIYGLVEAARILCEEGFKVFPYTTDDIVAGEKLLQAGCEVLMPWCAPIGSAKGPVNPDALRSYRAHFPEIPLVIDAGLGRPSHAAQVMELGYDAVLLNTAVARAGNPVAMAAAFAKAVDAGRQAYQAQPLEPRDMAVPSTPVIGLAVFE